MNRLVVIIGASRGIGRALVERFAQDHSTTVYALSRDVQLMNERFSEYTNVVSHAFDLAGDCKKQLSAIFKEVSKIDILINNAGYLVNKPFTELTHEDLTRSYQINVIGIMESVQTLLPQLEGGSHIVNISSMGGFQGTVKFAGLAAYSTSKAALVSFTELFAEEYKESNIKMNCLCLGAVQTEMLEEAFPGYQATVQPSSMATYICDFAQNAHQWMHGRIVPVSLTTP